MRTHVHICGLRTLLQPDPPSILSGCGFTWKHVRLTGVTDAVYAKNHLCPNCGLGPWFAVADPWRDNTRLTPYPPMIGMGAVLRPNPNNPAYIPESDLSELYEYARNRQAVETALEGIEVLLGDGGPMAFDLDGLALIIDPKNKTIAGFKVEGKKR